MRRIQYDPVIDIILGAAFDNYTSTSYILIVRSTQLDGKVLIYHCHKNAPHTI